MSYGEPAKISLKLSAFATTNDVNPDLVRIGQCLFAFGDEREFRDTVLVCLCQIKLNDLVMPPILAFFCTPLPFLPLESEIDQLIAACGKKATAFLQLLKETAMRVGEANKLEWTDIDFARKAITLNNPEKNGNPRMFKVSTKLLNMLSTLPKKDQRVFGNCRNWHQATFHKSRKRIAGKLGNPRILKIHFHTLRHWKATMLYHRTKDILYIKEFLGHRRIEDTLLYVQIAEVIFKETNDEFTVRVASKPEEIKALLEVGFEYVCEKDGLVFFRKRK